MHRSTYSRSRTGHAIRCSRIIDPVPTVVPVALDVFCAHCSWRFPAVPAVVNDPSMVSDITFEVVFVPALTVSVPTWLMATCPVRLTALRLAEYRSTAPAGAVNVHLRSPVVFAAPL